MERISTRTLSIYGFAFIAFANGADIISKGGDIQKVLIFCAPFLVFIGLLIAIRKKLITSIIFLLLALITQFGTEDQGNYSAAVFLIFAFAEYPKRRFIFPSLVLFAFAIFGNYVFVKHTVADFANISALYIFIALLYYKKFHPKRPRPMPHPLHKPDDLIIADGIFHGRTSKEIAFDLDIKESAVNSRLARMREKYPPGTTTTRMIICLYDAGTIPIGENGAL